MNTSHRYPEIVVTGPPRELGRQIGEAAGEQIRGFCQIAMERVNRTVSISREAALNVARDCIPFAQQYSPEMMEELSGTAEAARVPLEDLMLLQIRNQLRTPDAGCTSLSLGPPRSPEAIVAQNWDADPALDEFTIVLTRRPTGKPAVMTLTQAGLIAYIGLNSASIGLCANTLPAPCRQVGVPHYFLMRGIFESTSLDEAVKAVSRAERAMPANIMLSTPQGPADLEVTIDAVHVLESHGTGLVTHTNHCRHPELLTINAQFPELIQSYARQSRIDQLMSPAGPGKSTTASAPGNTDCKQITAPSQVESIVEHLQSALCDHEGYPRSICRHANDDQPTGFWQTVFSIIIRPEHQQMLVTRGNPCTSPFELYTL